MDCAPSPTPMVDAVLASLVRCGYDVAHCAVNPQVAGRVAGCRFDLSLGEDVSEPSGSRPISLLGDLRLCGDIPSGKLRRWRISRTFRAGGGCPRLVVDLAFVVEGDFTATFLRREGCTGLDMLLVMLSDAMATLSDLPTVTNASGHEEPVVAIGMQVLGELATGRCGVLRNDFYRPAITKRALSARSAVCARLTGEILPEIATACLDAILRVRPTQARAVRFARRMDTAHTTSIDVAPSPVDLRPARSPSSPIIQPLQRGRHVH